MAVDQGASIGKLSKDLSINDNLIRFWVKQYQLEQTGTVLQGVKLLIREQQRIRELKKKINLLD
jgi:transposase-like protein